METPHPYSQRKLRDGTVLREFRADTRSEELVWHQDREHRSVRVIESGGWMLQLEEGLPFPLVEGNTYEIPPRSWHRVLRGPGKLKIEIQEGNTVRITESQLRKIVRNEIRRLHESTGEVEEEVDAQNFGHLEVGNRYTVVGMSGANEFVGWFTESGEKAAALVRPEKTTLVFRDTVGGDEWEAYFHRGKFCWGTSADPLIVQEAR